MFKKLYLKVSVSAKVLAIRGIGIGEYLGIGENFGIGAALVFTEGRDAKM